MKIIDTFDVVSGCLYSVKYDTEQKHEMDKCFDNWNDPVYLREFFENNEDLLNNEFWQGISIEEAIKKTRNEAISLEKDLLDYAELGKTNQFENLSSIFVPLERDKVEDFERDKAKPDARRSWIRIYAIRVDANLFVISGGAIKLTHRMGDSEHLRTELKKLELSREYVMDKYKDGIDFVEIRL